MVLVCYLTFELTMWFPKLCNKSCLTCDSIPTYVMHGGDGSGAANLECTNRNPP